MTQQPTPPTCTFTLRAETGPCEYEYHGEDRKRCASPPTAWHHATEETHDAVVLKLGHPYLGPGLGVCGHAESEHPDEGMVRFEWAETARPEGFWYYRAADLTEPSVLRRDHAFEIREDDDA